MSMNVQLSFKEKLSYGVGDGACNISLGLVTLFLLYFYTDIYGLTAAQGGTIFLVGRIVEAVFNLFLGYKIDTYQTEKDKFKPFIFYGAIPLGLITVALFYNFSSDYKFTFALFSYCLYCVLFTIIQTPYTALNNVMTQHEESRTSLSVYRFMCASGGYLLVSYFTETIVSQFDEGGYFYAAIFYSIIATVLLYICQGNVNERVKEAQPQKSSLREQIDIVKSNHPLQLLSAYTGLVYVVYILWFALAVYYINYVMNEPEFVSTFFLVQICAYVVGTLISGALSERFGRKPVIQISLLLSGLVLCLQYIYTESFFIVMVSVVVFQICLAINFVLMWAMAADTIEYSEWKSKKRNEGIIYGYYNFIVRVAMGIGGAIAGFVLNYFEYNPTDVTDVAVSGINFSFTVLPSILMVLSMMFVFLYPIDEKTYKTIVAEIRNV